MKLDPKENIKQKDIMMKFQILSKSKYISWVNTYTERNYSSLDHYKIIFLLLTTVLKSYRNFINNILSRQQLSYQTHKMLDMKFACNLFINYYSYIVFYWFIEAYFKTIFF